MNTNNTHDNDNFDKNIKNIIDRASTSNNDFLATISHEMRTPLNGIIGVIDLISHETENDNFTLYVQTLEQSCRTLLSVVNRLQDISDLQTTNPISEGVDFDIRAILSGISENMQFLDSTSKETTQVEVCIDRRIPSNLKGDLTKIQQTLTNLVTIAANISKNHHSKINIRLKYHYNQQAIIHVQVETDELSSKEYFSLLSIEELVFNDEDLFDSRSIKHMAIGLNICKKFIDKLGGHLSITRQDKTLKFCFDFELLARDNLPKNEESIKLEDLNILVVEDNRINLMVVLKMLKYLHVHVDTAENGLVAVEKMKTNKYNIVLMDLDMPVMNGYDATEKIREFDSVTVIIALTANSTNEAKIKCKVVGMNDYFTKPLTIKTLEEMLHKWK